MYEKEFSTIGETDRHFSCKRHLSCTKSDRDFSIEGVVIEQTELYNKKNESGIDVADLNTGICIMYTENIDNMIMSVKIVNNINI